MGALNEILGGSHDFTHRGKTYKVGLINQEVKNALEKQLFSQARDAARELRDCMSREEYRDHLANLNKDYIEGEFAFESRRCRKYIRTVPGMLALTAMLWGCPRDEMFLIMKERREEVTALLEVIFKESFVITDEEMAQAKAEAQADDEAGQGPD